MATFTSSKVSAVGGSGKGYVVVNITKKSDTVGHIKVDYKFDGYFLIMADISKSDWTFSSSIVSGSLSEPPGTIGDGSYSSSWHINTIEKDFTLPKSDTTTSLSFSFQSNLPYNPPDYPENNYSYSGSVSVTFPKGNYYSPPSNLRLSSSEITTTSFKITANWTGGQESDGRAYVKIGSGSEKLIDNDPVYFTDLTPNTTYTVNGRLADDVNPSASYDTASIKVLTKIAPPSSWTVATSTTDSITLEVTSPNGTVNLKYQYQLNGGEWQDSGLFTGLTSNTNYPVAARAVNTSTGDISDILSGNVWTHPAINVLNVSLRAGSEHNTIDANASAIVSTEYDQFIFSLDSTWGNWGSSNATWGGLEGHSTHTIGVKMRNTSSGYESAEVTKSITTWYNPLTNLKVNLVNRWFWYLLINCSYDYQGGPENIAKYEFDIGNEGYKDAGKTNSYSRGTTSPGGNNKLSYNTDYPCKVRVTDNHGRQYQASATFKTLDARCSYVNGTLKEVFIVKPDNSIVMMTPNLCTIITKDGAIVNMNKIVNNDDRLEYR